MFRPQRFRTSDETEISLLTSSSFTRLGVPHGFTYRLRHGAGSEVFGRRDAGASDRTLLAEAMALSGLAYMKQVHGCDVRQADSAGAVGECDSVIGSERSLGLIVHTADCVPLLFWNERANSVGAAHAGWRGTLRQVATATGGRLLDVDGRKGQVGDALHVLIGPAIRGCCFEVGDEVFAAFRERGAEMDGLVLPGHSARDHFDLIEENRRQLLKLGIPSGQIYDSEICTVCSNESFYSYRAEGPGVGRIMGVIAPRKTVISEQ